MTYPLITEYNITGLPSLVDYANVITNNFFGLLIIVGLFFVAFITAKIKNTPNQDALYISFLISVITGIMFIFMNFIKGNGLTVFIILFFLTGLWIIIEKKNP